MNFLDNKINNISSIGEHYLIKAKSTNHKYFDDFMETAIALNQLLSKSEFDSWAVVKMQLRQQPFNEKKIYSISS